MVAALVGNIWTPARAHRDPAAASLRVLAGAPADGDPAGRGERGARSGQLAAFRESARRGERPTNIVAGQEAVVGFYGERVLPRTLNAACGTKAVEPLRRRVCGGLAGAVVEIGFGSGLNVPFYPAAVSLATAVECSDSHSRITARPAME